MRKYLVALVVIVGLAAPVAAHADTFTYNLVLTDLFAGPVGTGSFTITSLATPLLSAFSTKDGTLTDMNFSIGGDTFNLTDATDHYGAVGFLLGIPGFAFGSGNLLGPVGFGAVGPLYTFADLSKLELSGGTIKVESITDNPGTSTVTPEPSALVLFGTGALGLAALASRRRIA